MSERIRTLTNVAARSKTEEELIELLTGIFIEVEGRHPGIPEWRGIKDAVEHLKGNLLNWSVIEKGLREQTWVVEGGARDLMGDM